MRPRVSPLTTAAPALATLVPQLALELAESDGNVHRSIDGSMLSADISGFTALTERLASRGKAGAEEITRLINRCFTELIEAAEATGGEIIKFGGDAILVLFRDENHRLRAAAAAASMHHALQRSPSARHDDLAMTVGASDGPFECFLAGSSARELLIVGERASRVIELESRADHGETLVNEGVAAVLPPGFCQRDGDAHRLSGDPDVRPTGPRPRSVVGADLSGLVPAAVGDHFDGFADLGGEHRLATIGFLQVGRVDDSLRQRDPVAVAADLGALVDEVHQAGLEFGVTPLHTDIAPGGLKFLLCAGAPYTADLPSDAMIEVALRIVALDSPFSLRFGLQRGRVFAGFLGSAHRRTYTLMSDPVNTAARMTGRAGDREIVAVAGVLDDTRTVYETEEIEPFLVKGKSAPVSARRIRSATGRARTAADANAMVGRGAELGDLRAAIAAGAGMVHLVGPPGSGKTRVLDELRAELDDRPTIAASCSPYAATTAYEFLAGVARRALGIDPAADPVEAGRALAVVVARLAPDLLPMLPILAIPVRASVEATDEASDIDPLFLRDRIHELLAEVLDLALPPEALLLLDDAHWADAASIDFLMFALRREGRVGFGAVVATRPDPGRLGPALDGAPSIELGPLPDREVSRLVIESSGSDLPDAVVRRVTDLADGNPLFAIELTRTVDRVGDVDISETVEQLVATRVDALPADQRRVLRVAAVLGTEFRRSDLAAALGMESVDLVPLSEFLTNGSGESVAFRNVLFRDVAYEGLPYAQRKRLHRRVGLHLEAKAADPALQADLLATHFSAAGDSNRAWRYGVAAGDQASARAASVEAAAAYERALAGAAHLRSVDADAVARVAMALGDLHEILGDYGRSERSYQRARRLSQSASVQVNAMLQIGQLREKQGRYPEAGRWYDRAEAAIPAIEGDESNAEEVWLLRSGVWYQRAGLHHRRGDHQDGIEAARLALGWAEDADDLRAMARALHRLHLNTVYLGREDRIRYGERALELFTALGAHERQSSVLNNLGIGSYFANRWSEAATYYHRATESGLRAGSVIDGLLGTVNSAEILSDQGHWDEAIERFEVARRNFDGGRYPMGVAMVRTFLGVAHFRRDDVELAIAFLEQAIEELEALRLAEVEADARTRLLEVLVESGRVGVAEVEAERRRLGAEHPLAGRLRYLRGLAAVLEGRWSEWRSDLAELVEEQTGYDRALTLRLLAHGDGPAADPALRQEADRTFEALGVVRLRPLPVGEPR